MATNPKIIVVGGGLAGLSAVIKIAEMGGQVDLFSIVPVKRSHSVCAQGGINAAKNLKGEGDSTWQHLDDTVYGGDFLGNQPPIKAMCDAAPTIIDLLDRMGVPFNRTPEGLLDFRRFGGTLHHRSAFAAAFAPWICVRWKFAPSLLTRSSSQPAALARFLGRARTPWSVPDRRNPRFISRGAITRMENSSKYIPLRFRARTSCG